MAGDRGLVVITGAASGLGQAIAVEVARRGYDVVGADLRAGATAETAALVAAEGGGLHEVVCDVRDVTQVQALLDAALGLGRPLALWVNNAGVAAAGSVGEAPLEDWRWVLDVNLMGMVHGCHVAVPALRAQGSGAVLNVASAAALVVSPGMGAYNVSKAGVVALTQTLAGELVGTGVTATVLCPTFFQTNLLDTARTSDPRLLRLAGRLMKTSRWSAPDVARVAVDDALRGRLVSVPMADGRLLWALHRMMPQGFHRLLGRVAPRLPR